MAEETHHIKYQKDADSNGFIGHIHKNNKSNLVPLCKECHKKETYGKINIIGWVDATDGRKLKVTRGENMELTDFTYNYIPTNKIIYEDFQKGEDSNSLNGSEFKSKRFQKSNKRATRLYFQIFQKIFKFENKRFTIQDKR